MEVNARNRTDFPKRARGLRAVASRGAKATIASEKPYKRSFLNHKFDNIPLFEVENFGKKMFAQSSDKGVVSWLYGENICINATENLATLAKSAEAYCNVHGGSLHWEPTTNPMKDLQSLYMQMLRCKPEGNELSIDYNEKNKTLDFLEYSIPEFMEYQVFMLTIDFLEHIPVSYQEPMRLFLKYLCVNEDFSYLDDSMDMAFALGLWDEQMADDEPDEEIQEWRKNYLSGKISKYIKSVIESEYVKAEELIPIMKDAAENCPIAEAGAIFALALDGLQLMKDDCMRSYRHRPTDSTIPEFSKEDFDGYMDFNRLFILCWSDDSIDPISEMALQCLNWDGECLSMDHLWDFRVITPEVKDKFKPSEYPIKWCRWFNAFINKVENYERNFRKNV